LTVDLNMSDEMTMCEIASPAATAVTSEAAGCVVTFPVVELVETIGQWSDPGAVG
jgi:hypothetical protein